MAECGGYARRHWRIMADFTQDRSGFVHAGPPFQATVSHGRIWRTAPDGYVDSPASPIASLIAPSKLWGREDSVRTLNLDARTDTDGDESTGRARIDFSLGMIIG